MKLSNYRIKKLVITKTNFMRLMRCRSQISLMISNKKFNTHFGEYDVSLFKEIGAALACSKEGRVK